MTRGRLAAAAVTACFAVTAALAGAAPAAAMVTGLGEQNPGFLDDPLFLDLRIDAVRVVVPWDAALTDDVSARTWIERALSLGDVPLVAFEKSRGVVCPGAGCQAPSPADYEAGVAAFRARWPQIVELTPWNEPNHRSQPTYGSAALAAEYYNAARRACPSCTLVAGDLLDDGNLSSWIAGYRAALAEQPAVWGLHNYYDATYFSSRGLDTLTRATDSEIWLTETGGIVRFSAPGGAGLPYDEKRAADSISWLYALTARQPRVGRMYLYHWQARTDNDFDGGLLGPQREPRPGLDVVHDHIRPGAAGPLGRGSAAASPAAGAAARRTSQVRLRLSDKGLRLVRRGLRVGVACISAPGHCVGRLVATIPRSVRTDYRPRLRMNFDLAPGRSLVHDLRMSRRTRAALERRSRLQVSYCLGGTRECRTVQRALVTHAKR